MASLDVNGVGLFWTERGSGPAVLFIHGIPTDYRAWDAQVNALSDGFRTITYSRRYAYPNGRAGDVSDSTVENNARDLAGLIDQLGVSPVHLVGHSYGGFIAAYLALEQPALLRTLTLVEPAIAPLLLRDPASAGQKLALLLRHPRIALSAQRYLTRSNGPALEALRRSDTEAAVRLNLDGIEARRGAFDLLPISVQKMVLDNGRTVRETETAFPMVTSAQLGALHVPTLVLHGETSALWLRAIARRTGAAIPGADVVGIPGSGHFPHIQNPSAFNAALRTFLQRHERPK
jgi:non-heme chloroperoxidase